MEIHFKGLLEPLLPNQQDFKCQLNYWIRDIETVDESTISVAKWYQCIILSEIKLYSSSEHRRL